MLDPACGSGNFLYVSLQLLLSLEKEVIAYATQLGFAFKPQVNVQQLRALGLRLDFPLAPAKVGKQFQAAEQAGARLAVLIGDEWPALKIKTLATRE